MDEGTCILCKNTYDIANSRVGGYYGEEYYICRKCMENARSDILYSIDMAYILEFVVDQDISIEDMELLIKDDFKELKDIIDYELGEVLEYFDIYDIVRNTIRNLRKEEG